MSKPIWEPSPERIDRANISRFMRFVREQTSNADMRRYAPLYDFSVRQPEKFWSLVWEFCGIRASGAFEQVLVDADKIPGARWFPGVRLNFAQNLLRFKDERAAIVFRNDSGQAREISYAQLHQHVARLACAMRAAGVQPGDRIAAVLPNIPEAVIAMLATTALGAVWSACAPTLDAAAMTAHFSQVAPKLVFTVDALPDAGTPIDCFGKVLDALSPIPSVEKWIVVGYADPDLGSVANGVTWDNFCTESDQPIPFELTGFDHPLYIVPKPASDKASAAVVYGVGGTLIQHLKELVLHADIKREDKVFCEGDGLLWHWQVSCLAIGASLVLYDGRPMPAEAATLWDLVDELGISVLTTRSGWLAAMATGGFRPQETHKLLNLKTILSSGTPLSVSTSRFVYQAIKDRLMLSPLHAGTAQLSFIALGCPLLPVYAGEIACRGLGMKVEVLADDGGVLKEEAGRLACLAPFPAMPLGFCADPDGTKYHNAYFSHFPNIWCEGVRATLTERDGVIVHPATDDSGA